MGDITPNQRNGPEPTLFQITSLFQTKNKTVCSCQIIKEKSIPFIVNINTQIYYD